MITALKWRPALLAIRLAVVNFSPAIKRIFFWQPEAYMLLSLLGLLATLRFGFSRRRAIFSLIAVLWLLFNRASNASISLYVPLLLVWTFSLSLSEETVESAYWKLRFIFVASVVYGISQKIFGYFPHELSWIYSGVGAVREEGYFVTEEIRSFSFFAGIPEFGFFSAIILFFALRRNNVFYIIVSAIGVYLAGSRGVILSASIGLLIALPYSAIHQKKLIGLGFVLAVGAYVWLAVILPGTGFLEVKTDDSRLLVYGTFGYRVSMLIDFLAEVNLKNIWFGVKSSRTLYDNFYLTLINDFGIVGSMVFLSATFRNISSKSGVYVSVMLLSYCLYADALFSVYLMFNAWLVLNSRSSADSSEIIRQKLDMDYRVFPQGSSPRNGKRGG